MKRWIDVDPLDWFYRDMLDMARLGLDARNEHSFIEGMPYDTFEQGHERIVKRFVTFDGQQEFAIPGYQMHIENPVFVFVAGVQVQPERMENEKITMPHPLSGGLEVVCIAYGRPAYQGDGCVQKPYMDTDESLITLPSATLSMAADYQSQTKYQPETVTVLGTKLKRLPVKIQSEEDPREVIKKAFEFRQDAFVIHQGIVYLPFNYNGFPATVGYNYREAGSVQFKQETVVVSTAHARYHDRFFPNVRMKRAQFLILLQQMRVDIYNRYTDRGLESNMYPPRTLQDRSSFSGQWYEQDVMDLMSEQFLDESYVFPLYENNMLEPEKCITRAEAVVFLNRFIEWALEKFR
ncbi:hypothetical protein [Paenibacillus terrae]|uniref:SLH domain-containing protein n=1 Tax=Paenibacillus terrae TaxID=159743 RepID=A0A0D7X7R6_9BACL|nr:hypothetical protein [Paenibacillus terrae]KJD47068.1 hypothetical protein QD47_02635 [Paenibacillus terrae]